MAITVLFSISGSPGVSTIAAALAHATGHRTMIVEADTSTTSRLIPGILRGMTSHTHGLTQLAIADNRGTITEQDLWDQAISITDNVTIIPGFRTLSSAHNASPGFWNALTFPLHAVAARGIDVIMDAGRVAYDDPRWALFQLADSITLVTDNTIPAVTSAHTLVRPAANPTGANPTTAGWLRTQLDEAGHGNYLDLIVVDHPTTAALADWSANTIPASEIKGALNANLLGGIPWDPKGASPFTFTVPATEIRRSPYIRAVRAISLTLTETTERRTTGDIRV